MWLYYAFMASVVLSVHSVSDLLNMDMLQDLALLDELRGLCEGLAAESDGARRVKEIVDGVGWVAWVVVKNAARRRKKSARKRDEGEGEKWLGVVSRTVLCRSAAMESGVW